MQPGQVFAPIHWTDEHAPSGRAGALIPAQTDPVSGQPELKAAIAQIAPYPAAWYGFAVSTTAPTTQTPYAGRAGTSAGWRIELADTATPADWESYARTLFALPDATALRVIDHKRGLARIALRDHGILQAALVAGPNSGAVPVRIARPRPDTLCLLWGGGEHHPDRD